MAERIDVFVSSTSRDLMPYRDVVTKVILQSGLHPIIMEAFNPTDHNALQHCYDRVQIAGVFVGIYAHRYGCAPDSDSAYTRADGTQCAGDGETSITHLEYQWAAERSLPMLLFIVSDTDANGDSLDWPQTLVEGEPGQTRLKKFKESLMAKHLVGFFHSPDHLASQLATALLELLIREVYTKQTDEQVSISNLPQVVGERVAVISSYFRDRDSQAQEIRRMLADHSTRVISVIGRGGIGKSAVVTRVLFELESGIMADDATGRVAVDGILYLSTRTKGITLERIFLDCAELVDDPHREQIIAIWTNPNLQIDEKVTRFLHELKSGSYIFFLDNMEDLLNDAGEIEDGELRAFVEAVLGSPYPPRLIITSREPLKFSVEMARFDKRLVMDEGLPEADAVKVLRDLDPYGEYGLRDAQDNRLRQLAVKVYGFPRALEIIASILAGDPFLSVEDFIRNENLFAQDKFVERLVRENYRRLNQDAQFVMQALSVLKSPAPIRAVEYLLQPFLPLPRIRETVIQLIQRHTVLFDRKTKLISLHPFDQDYTYQQIPEDLSTC